MIRTQISLEAEMYRRAQATAKRAGISVAELVRRAVGRMLGEARDDRQPWMSYAGVIASGDPQASRSVNDVYRRPRP